MIRISGPKDNVVHVNLNNQNVIFDFFDKQGVINCSFGEIVIELER
jgi:hypothetical protein